MEENAQVNALTQEIQQIDSQETGAVVQIEERLDDERRRIIDDTESRIRDIQASAARQVDEVRDEQIRRIRDAEIDARREEESVVRSLEEKKQDLAQQRALASSPYSYSQAA